MIVLIDGFSIAFRAFYALPETLVTSKGTPTNVIHGFMSMLNKITTDYKLEQLIVTWDLPCLLYTSPSPRDATLSRMPSSA